MGRLTLKSFLIISFNLILLQNVQGSPRLRPRIMIAQSDADTDNKFKHEVYLYYQNYGFCSGSIISDYHILTAAHCVVEANSSRILQHTVMSIKAGITNLNNPQERHTVRLVEKVYVPKEYYHRTDNVGLQKGDIAVLKLNYKLGLGLNPKISAMNIESTNNDVYNRMPYIVTGFGATKSEWEFIPNTTTFAYVPQDFAQQLRYAWVYVIDCYNFFNNNNLPNFHPLVMPEKKLCGVISIDIRVKKGICAGDSGGSLFDIDSNTIIGVISNGANSCDDRIRPTVFTKVKSYTKFIRDAMKDTPDPLTTQTVSLKGNSNYLQYLNSKRDLYHETTDGWQFLYYV